MSHHTRIKTEITDGGELKATLEELGCKVKETRDRIQTKAGQVLTPTACLMITALPTLEGVPVPDGAEANQIDPDEPSHLAFMKFGEAFELVADKRRYLPTVRTQFKDLVTRHYAYRLAKQKLEEQGFEVKSEEVANGKVRLLLSRDHQEVESSVDTDGKVSLTTRGFVGNECLAATKALEAALGGVVEEREMTLEGFFGPMPLVPPSGQGRECAVGRASEQTASRSIGALLPADPREGGKP